MRQPDTRRPGRRGRGFYGLRVGVGRAREKYDRQTAPGRGSELIPDAERRSKEDEAGPRGHTLPFLKHRNTCRRYFELAYVLFIRRFVRFSAYVFVSFARFPFVVSRVFCCVLSLRPLLAILVLVGSGGERDTPPVPIRSGDTGILYSRILGFPLA